ncbi:eukaryotic translation initiation factor 2C, 2, partial [Podila humilis]
MASRNKGKGTRSTLDAAAADSAGISPAFYKELQDTFRIHDSESSGYLGTKKLQLAMRTVGFEASLTDIREIIESMPTLSAHNTTRYGSNSKLRKLNKDDKGKSARSSTKTAAGQTSARRSTRKTALETRTGQKSKYVDDSNEESSGNGDDSDQDKYMESDDESLDNKDLTDTNVLRFTFNDFVTIMTPGNDRFEQDELSRVFQLFDAQGKGYIRMDDLRRLANELGLSMTDQQLEEMMDEADRDGNGAVTPDEFGRIMKKTAMSSNAAPQLTQIARRPDSGGQDGRRTRINANFFAIPQLWKEIEALPELIKSKSVYDGRANAFSAVELQFQEGQGITRQVVLPDAGPPRPPPASSSGGAPPPRKRNEFTVKLALVARIDLSELHKFLRREGPLTPACSMALNALNVVMTHKLFSEQVNVGRSAFTPNGAQDLSGGIEKWDGIFQSIRPGQNQLFANIDVATGAFIKGGNAAGLIVEVLKMRGPDDLQRRPLQSRDFQTLHKHFKSCSFTVTHRGAGFKKSYKVSEVSMMSADKLTFEQTLNNGQVARVSIPQYYEKAYGLVLRYPLMPCFGVKGRDSVLYFPAEVCVVTPGKRFTKRLNPEQTAAMIKSTCTKPHIRAERIHRNIHDLNLREDEYMRKFRLDIVPKMVEVPARILEAPKIEHANRSLTRPDSGGWRMDPSKKMYKGRSLESWGILVFENEGSFSRQMVQNFVRELVATMAENGMNVVERQPHIMYGQNHQVERNVDSIWEAVERQCRSPPQIILVVLPMVCQTYSAVKTYCETTRDGRMTQCVLSSKIKRVNKQYCGMLGLKINAKLGGINSTLEKNSIPFVTSAPTIIIGADVTHPMSSEARPSVVAVVGSMDEHAFRYAGRLQTQDSRCEVIDRLKYLVYELLVTFTKRNGGYRPQRILFYRDGVSDGQFAQVMQEEVKAIKEACDHMRREGGEDKYSPALTFCVVKKRHHARFFPIRREDGDRSGNCMAGTVVDSMITHPTEFDFYLQSHGGLQGTSRPTLYHVLVDENRFTSDQLQELTYRLCHLYSRCPKSVSIVPPVYYAHLLAYRARHYQSTEFSDSASAGSAGTEYISFQTS